jgi:hypothetical protein
MNYEKDITIDESGLDIEWLNQPRLMIQYATHLAEMSLRLDKKKSLLELKKAELDKAIRGNPDRFGVAKPTETAILNAIMMNEEYQEIEHQVLDAKYQVDIAKAAVRAIDGKKDALENLVRLHGQQYFAGPKLPRDLSAEWERKMSQRRVDSGVAEKLRRTKK